MNTALDRFSLAAALAGLSSLSGNSGPKLSSLDLGGWLMFIFVVLALAVWILNGEGIEWRS